MPASPTLIARRRLGLGAFLLGWGLGSFLDGILLHQILQWHHLLSGVAPDGTVRSLRFQILADGAFHAAAFLVTLLGLWLLWAARAGLDEAGAGRRLLGYTFVGVGMWHIVDAAAFHWVLQLHRIRMDTGNPLLWDLLWFVPFGLGALVLGLWLVRGARGGGDGRRAAHAVSLAVLIAGPAALLPPAGLPEDRALAVFLPGMDFPAIVAAAEAAGGHPVWSDAEGGVWVIAFEPGGRPGALYRHGALMVSNGPVAAGCLSWATMPEV